MRRLLVVMVGMAALLTTAVPEAATPVSVIGTGKTLIVSCPQSSCSQIKKAVTVSTANNTGVLVIGGTDQGRVTCVRSAKVSGRVGVVVGATSTASPATHELFLAINEGGRGRQPWAVAFFAQKSALTGGECGGHVTAQYVAGYYLPQGTVPATQFVVVGGSTTFV